MFHGIYEGLLRELVINYKFTGNIGQSTLLGTMVCETFARAHARIPDCIVPVPLHTRRLQKRGFNQSLELSRLLSRKINRPLLSHGLHRVRNTPPQTRLGHRERQENIRDAFVADRELIEGKNILLVDDVFTTGATLSECAITLRRAGASGTDVLVLARAVQD
ncbi:hypothetical protein PSDVSF_14450 [Pseudodesulfovibrio sediminis]|uniref:Phosphoribosyltransferase n=2 Tax=Pseudodesulfovibrio sediminis TaxID=2810563 RepID=A0ABM8I3C3_9BACT|nr:hypothetical protein PSDVSF_14450 [Pseudodesulfovibrio sediminis]